MKFETILKERLVELDRLYSEWIGDGDYYKIRDIESLININETYLRLLSVGKFAKTFH